MNFFEQLKRAFAISRKDLTIYFLKGPTLIFGLLLPSFLFIAFMLGRNLSIEILMPGLVGMALFFTTSAIGPMITPWETRMKTFERLVSTPVALWSILLGDIIASFLFGLFITSFILIIGVVLLGLGIVNLYLIIGTVLSAFCFSTLGSLMSAPPTDTPSNIMMLSTLIKFPLIFISGVFIPIGEMGKFKIISYISPLTYYIDLVRLSIQGKSHFMPIVDILALIGFIILFFVVAVKWHRKSLVKRF